MQEFFLTGRGIAYRANDLRPGRPTLVFVHGLSGSLSAWQPFEPIFTDRYNIVTFDLRGHGYSTRPDADGYRLEEFVKDIHALLAELSIGSCTLVSHSFGTLIAMEFARAYPAMVERAVFIAPAYGVDDFSTTRFLSNIAAALAFFPLRLRSYRRTNYARYRPTADYNPSRIATDILNMGLISYIRCMRTIFAEGHDADWLSLTMPILLIHGRHDGIVPLSHAHALKRALPHAELAELDGNHILVLNNIDQVARLIEKFVAQ